MNTARVKATLCFCGLPLVGHPKCRRCGVHFGKLHEFKQSTQVSFLCEQCFSEMGRPNSALWLVGQIVHNIEFLRKEQKLETDPFVLTRIEAKINTYQNVLTMIKGEEETDGKPKKSHHRTRI